MKRDQAFFNIDLEGLDRLEKKLQELPEKLRRKSLRQALKAGTNIVKDEAKRLAPKAGRAIKDDFLFFLSGPDLPKHLRDHIVSQVTVTGDRAWGRVGIDYRQVRHGHLVEFGTSPHPIKIKINNRTITVNHPGSRKQPFMRPAVENKGEEAVNTMANMLFDAVMEGIK